jgi:hypothetical protein
MDYIKAKQIEGDTNLKKQNAKKILSLSDEHLIRYWESVQSEQYLSLLETMSKEDIVKHVKKICEDILQDRPTLFKVGDKIKIEYLGEEE